MWNIVLISHGCNIYKVCLDLEHGQTILLYKQLLIQIIYESCNITESAPNFSESTTVKSFHAESENQRKNLRDIYVGHKTYNTIDFFRNNISDNK